MHSQDPTDNAAIFDPAKVLEQVAETHFSFPDAVVTQEELDQWKPRFSIWSGIQTVTRLLPGLRTRYKQVDGHNICYWELGQPSRPTLVLVHGFGASKDNWLTLALRLSRSFHILIPDVPGFGESSYRSRSRYTYPRQAARLAEWYGKLGLKPAHWVGSSMGGAISAVVAANHPEHVASLCLMNAAGVAGPDKSALERQLLEGRNSLIPRTPEDVVNLFRMTTHRNQGLWTRVIPPVMGRDILHRSVINRHLFRDMMHPETATSSLLPKVSAPTLVMWGDQDQILHVCCADVFKSLIPHAEVKVFRDIGHLPMLEAPGLTIRHLQRFWQKTETP